MAELLSAGVFIEEVPSQVQAIQAVSTSNLGAVGFTTKGPVNTPTLVTSFGQFTSKFGGLTPNGLLPISMAAFFQNGGRRAFITRVVPSDAVEADSKVLSTTTNQEIESGDGAATNFAKTEATSLLKDNDGDSPLSPSSFTLTWRGAGTPVATEDMRNRADDADVALASGTANYEARVNPASLPSFYEPLDSIVRGTATLTFNPDGGGDRTIAIPVGTGSIVTVTNVEGTVVVLDHRTGILSVKFAGSDVPGAGATGNLRLSYTPTTENFQAVDDGSGALINSPADGGGLATATGTITTVAVVSLIDGETVTIGDGVNPAVVFEFDVTPDGVTPGNRTVDVSADVTADDVKTTLIAAINGARDAGLLNVTASDGGASTVNLLSHTPGTAGNVLITDTVADGGFATTGMAGGVDSTISYTDGSYDFTTSTAGTPHDEARILATYDIEAWDLDPISAGAWGNDLRLDIEGNADFFVASTGQYSRFDVNVLLRNETVATAFDVQETYEALDFSDPLSTSFWADVVNELSDLVSVVDPGGNEAPGQLQTIGRTVVLAGGDETTGGRTITHTLSTPTLPLQPRTFSLAYTDSTGTARVVTDDGLGNLIGDIDAVGNNTINYTTGAIDVTLLNPMQGGTLAVLTYWSEAEETANENGFTGGSDGTFTPSTYGRNQVSNPTLEPANEGVFALNLIDELMQVIVPDFVGDVVITGDLIDFAEARALQPSGGDRFLILQPPAGSDAQEAVSWLENDLGRNTKWGAIYWPHVKVADPLSPIGAPIVIPVVGHIAGVYARTDQTRNVGKAPAGTNDGRLNFLLDLEIPNEQGTRDFVYPRRINPLRNDTPVGGPVVWGARTFAGPGEAEWTNIQARRTFMFVEKSVFNSTHWIVFENNGPNLWNRIKTQLVGFLSAQFSDGLFAGNTPTEAFFVIVDESNNDPDSNQVIIDVGIAPNTPAEFVRFRFTQKTLN